MSLCNQPCFIACTCPVEMGLVVWEEEFGQSPCSEYNCQQWLVEGYSNQQTVHTRQESHESCLGLKPSFGFRNKNLHCIEKVLSCNRMLRALDLKELNSNDLSSFLQFEQKKCHVATDPEKNKNFLFLWHDDTTLQWFVLFTFCEKCKQNKSFLFWFCFAGV